MKHDHPREAGLLDVGSGQRVYWEEWGEATGVPALYLHGGPGGTLARSTYRHRFDLGRTRLIALEQRGCGRSSPHLGEHGATLHGNDTSRLVQDLERLRRHLAVDHWIVTGTSWGTTLALVYALAHRERVLGMTLFAVTTTSRREVDWITEGVGSVFPEAWDRFAAHAERAGIGYRRGHGRLVEAYRCLLESPDPATRVAASAEWARWEDTHVSLGAGRVHPDPRWEDERFRIAFFRLTAHYWSRDGFCDPPLLDRAELLRGVPAVLLHGRRDISSPACTAWELHRRWPGSELVIDEGDGHGGTSMVNRWRAANDMLVARFG